MNDMPEVTVVIATKDRPQKLARLLASVRSQDFAGFECIVVDDGSSGETRAEYERVWRDLDGRFTLLLRESSGGPSKSRNDGIRAARGRYVALCDDDDYWMEPDHLSTAVRAMNAAGAELYFSDMQTCVDGVIRDPSWYAVLDHVRKRRPVDGEADVFPLGEKDLANLLKFRILHANTLVVARDLFNRIGCYWEKISFAEDHDISFRLADAARGILFRNMVTATQDLTPHASIFATYVQRERNLFGIMAVHNAQLAISSPMLRKVCRGNRAWRMIELADVNLEGGNIDAARELALEACLLRPSKSSLLMLLKVTRRSLFARRPGGSRNAPPPS